MPDEMSKPLIRGGRGRFSHLEASVSEPGAPVIGILGTGDFSRSLARRLVASGYQVVVGSRTPKRSVALFPEEAEVTHTHFPSPCNWCFCFTPHGDNYILLRPPPPLKIITVAIIQNTKLVEPQMKAVVWEQSEAVNQSFLRFLLLCHQCVSECQPQHKRHSFSWMFNHLLALCFIAFVYL